MSDHSQILDDSIADSQHIEEICDAFESDWKYRPPSRLEDETTNSPQRESLLRELLSIEIVYQIIRGDQLEATKCITRFAGLDTMWVASLFVRQKQRLPSQQRHVVDPMHPQSAHPLRPACQPLSFVSSVDIPR